LLTQPSADPSIDSSSLGVDTGGRSVDSNGSEAGAARATMADVAGVATMTDTPATLSDVSARRFVGNASRVRLRRRRPRLPCRRRSSWTE
jgi:hypothetical protein